MYRAFVIIGFIGVLIGGFLMLRSVGKLLGQAQVALQNPPIAGLYLPRASTINSTDDRWPASYEVRFNNPGGFGFVQDSLEAQLGPQGWKLDEGGTPIAGRAEYRSAAAQPRVIVYIDDTDAGTSGAAPPEIVLRIEPAN